MRTYRTVDPHLVTCQGHWPCELRDFWALLLVVEPDELLPRRRKPARAPVSVFNLPLKRPSIKGGGDGWESNPTQDASRRPANGFEACGAEIHSRP